MGKLKSTLFYSFSLYLNKFLSLFLNLAIRKFLNPSMIGGITFVNVISRYTEYIYSPIRSAIIIEAPLLNGQNKKIEAQKIIETGYILNLIFSVFVSIGILIMINNNENIYVKFGLVTLIFTSFFSTMANYYEVYLRIKEEFDVISKRTFFLGIINPILTMILTYFFNYKGFFLSVLSLSFFSFIFFRKKVIINTSFDFLSLKRILLVGVPFFIQGMIFANMQNLDKVMIKYFLKEEQLGYYSIGDLFFFNIILLSASIYSLQSTSLLEEIGRSEEELVFFRIKSISTIVRIIMPLVIGFLWIFIDVIVNIFLEKYKAGILSAKILLIGAYFFSLYNLHEIYLMGKAKTKKLILYSSLVLVGFAILLFIAIKYSGKIEFVALIVSLMYLVYSQLIICIAMKDMGKKLIERLKVVIQNILGGIPIYVLFIVEYLFREQDIVIKNTVVFFTLILISVLFFIINKKDTKIISKYLVSKILKGSGKK